MASRPAEESGCLYYSPVRERFEAPVPEVPVEAQGLVPHFGTPGGVLPQLTPRRKDSPSP